MLAKLFQVSTIIKIAQNKNAKIQDKKLIKEVKLNKKYISIPQYHSKKSNSFNDFIRYIQYLNRLINKKFIKYKISLIFLNCYFRNIILQEKSELKKI